MNLENSEGKSTITSEVSFRESYRFLQEERKKAEALRERTGSGRITTVVTIVAFALGGLILALQELGKTENFRGFEAHSPPFAIGL